MARWEKLLDGMRANPRGDWTIANIETVARAIGCDVRQPRRGSHYTITHPDMPDILTIPAHRPIKPVYIRRFVSIMESIK